MKTYYMGEPPFAPLLQPFAVVRRGLNKVERKLNNTLVLSPMVRAMNQATERVRTYFEGAFDRRFDLDTVEVIQLKDLDVDGESAKLGHWYQAVSEGIFNQMMSNLKADIGLDDKTFVDYGSGKGKVLFMAAEWGFKKAIGVEFSASLCEVAERNVAAYSLAKGGDSRSEFENICADAMEYTPPEEPLVLFFFSPFKGKIMKKVLDNIMETYATKPRPISIIFYGENKDTLRMLNETGFSSREIYLKPDWTCLEHYRTFFYHSKECH